MSEKNVLIRDWDLAERRKPVAELVVRQETAVVDFLPIKKIAPPAEMKAEALDQFSETKQDQQEPAKEPSAIPSASYGDVGHQYQVATKYAFYESDYPIDGITRIRRTDGNRNTITLDVMRHMQAKITEYAYELASELGLSCNRVYLDKNIGDDALDFRVSFSTINHVGMDKFAKDFISKAESIGMHHTDYGRTFVKDNIEYVIDGLDVISNKIRVTHTSGRELLKVEVVKSAIDKHRIDNLSMETKSLLG